MNRIEEIKERLSKFQTAPREGFQKGLAIETVRVIGNFSDNAPSDIEYLLSRLQIAEEALKKISMHGPDSDEMIHIAEEALEQILEDEKK